MGSSRIAREELRRRGQFGTVQLSEFDHPISPAARRSPSATTFGAFVGLAALYSTDGRTEQGPRRFHRQDCTRFFLAQGPLAQRRATLRRAFDASPPNLVAIGEKGFAK
jgi:hypothetical protein